MEFLSSTLWYLYYRIFNPKASFQDMNCTILMVDYYNPKRRLKSSIASNELVTPAKMAEEALNKLWNLHS